MSFIEKLEKHFRDNYLTMFKQAKGMLKDHHYAEDAVQEAMYQAVKYGHEDIENFDGWIGMLLYNVCRRLAVDIKNKGVTLEVDPHLFPVEVFDVSPKSLIDLKKVIEDLFGDTLEGRCLSLWVVSGYSTKDVIEDFGISSSRLYYSWKKLKDHVRESECL